MKSIIGELDSSAVAGEIFYREVDATLDLKKKMIFIRVDGKINEIVNMGSSNFHSIRTVIERM